MAAKTAAKGKDKEQDPELEEPGTEEEEAPPVAEDAPPAAAAKRSIGAKEPIVFKWKLLALSDGVILTLFKAVEREEIDAHLERVTKEGHYTDLRIVDIGEKVVQTKSAIPVLHQPPEKPGAKAKKPAKAPPKKPKAVGKSVIRAVISAKAAPPKKKVSAKKPKKAAPTTKKKKK